MPHAEPRLFQAVGHIPSIGARAGNFILETPEGKLCVMHEEQADVLTPQDRELMRPIRHRLTIAS